MKNGTEIIKVRGLTFRIGYLSEPDISGYVCEMKKGGEWHGVLFVGINGKKELGWNSGIFATDEELTAINEARAVMKEKYGHGRLHG